jgi:hypothetical protein
MKSVEITDLPQLPPKIKQAIDDKELAIFIGAGVSRLIGCDGWDTLAKKLVEECAKKRYIEPITNDILLTQPDNIKLISICHNVFCEKPDEKSFIEVMRESLKDGEINKLAKSDDKFQIYKDLKNMGNTFITTNADRFIDKLLDVSNIIFRGVDLRGNNIGNDKLYKIHGCVSDTDSLVFTKNKYMSTYTNPEFTGFIKQFFSQYTVLFVGYGLNEFELLSKILPQNKNNEPRHFFLNPYYQHEQEVCSLESKYFSDLGINLIPFSKDKKNYDQLIDVIKNWNDVILKKTLSMQNSFSAIDKALKNPSLDNITTTIQNMKNNNRARYFFSKAHSYQKLHLWLELLLDDGFLSLNKSNEFQYWTILEFLEKTSIQNKEKEDEKSEITEKLLFIANQTIKQATNDHMVWYMIRVIFNLPIENITLEHIDFIDSYVRNCKHGSILNHDITKTVMPVLVENKMKEHMRRLLPLIFGYELKKDIVSHVEPIPIIEQYNLQELLKRHSQDMIELVGLDGLEIVVSLIKDITKQEKSTFNFVWLTVIRTETENEIKQNRHSDRYENQLIFFTRDLFESLSSDEIKPYIKDFLLTQQHPIFIRLALHVINCKYNDLKDIFWQWMDADVQYGRQDLELWTLLKESSKHFSNDEFKKIIDWIETFDCREYRPNDDDETIKKCNAYKRKEYLLCLKDNNKEAQTLYQKYHSIYDAEHKHPGFSYWFSGFHSVPKYSHLDKPDKKDPCQNIINTIQNFNPSEIEKKGFYHTDEDLKRGLANDLSTCIKSDPVTFENKIDEFKDLEYVYKSKVIQGFANAWQDKQKFDWKKVFDFINNELSPDFFNSDDHNKQDFVSEVANLIECGTREDSNAFDKKLFPKAKQILLNLLYNKYEEEECEGDNLIDHVLNSTNAQVLHTLINYAFRYGKLNSSQSIKWEEDIKIFFTEQLEKNNPYSRHVFTVLGTYLYQLQFLDNQWVIDNFNKIFPLENEKLWKASIEAYFFHVDDVYKETYNLFKSNSHIEKILLADFEKDGTKSKLISYVCIAYIDDIDNNTIFDIINSKNKGNILKIISSMLQIYKGEKYEKIKNKIRAIWSKIYEIHKNKNLENAKEIFAKLTGWFIFLDDISDEYMDLLECTVQYAKKGDYQSYVLMEEMARLSKNYPDKIGKLYKAIVKNKRYPCYKEEYINKILNNLNDKDKNEIKNAYMLEGIYLFRHS